MKLTQNPIPIETIRKQDKGNALEVDNLPHGFELPEKDVNVFEIWKVFLEENEDELNSVFVVFSAVFSQKGYKKGSWEDVEYRGFYTTMDEAKNEISGYLR